MRRSRLAIDRVESAILASSALAETRDHLAEDMRKEAVLDRESMNKASSIAARRIQQNHDELVDNLWTLWLGFQYHQLRWREAPASCGVSPTSMPSNHFFRWVRCNPTTYRITWELQSRLNHPTMFCCSCFLHKVWDHTQNISLVTQRKFRHQEYIHRHPEYSDKSRHPEYQFRHP